MTDNEKRAHDLTLCVLNRMDLKDNDISAAPLDFYPKYVEYYKTLIHEFEKDKYFND